MMPEAHPRSGSDDRMLYQLEQLPWPAYTLLIQSYFKTIGYRVRLVGSDPGQTDFTLVDPIGARHLLHCCSVRAAARLGTLQRLRCSMKHFHIENGILASPQLFSQALERAAQPLGIDVYGAGRLRSQMGLLGQDKRQRVLDAIKAKPDLSIGMEVSWLR